MFIALCPENTDLSTVAMAIAGYTEEHNTLWRKTCLSLLQKLDDPYLRAMFAFLTCDRENYEEILVSTRGGGEGVILQQ